jgi:hypothetical protein
MRVQSVSTGEPVPSSQVEMVSSRERQGLGPPQRHDYRHCRAGGREGSALQLYGSHMHARPQNWGCHWHFAQQRNPALREEVAEDLAYTGSPQCMSRHTALDQRQKWLKILAIRITPKYGTAYSISPKYATVCCRQYIIRPMYGNGVMHGNHQVGT